MMFSFPSFSVCYYTALLLGSIIVVLVIIQNSNRIKRRLDDNSQVRNVSHEVVNEATKLQYHMRDIANNPDPLRELVRRVRRTGVGI